MSKEIKFKHKTGKLINGSVIGSFIQKNKAKNTETQYLRVKTDTKIYSVNPKNIIENESN